MSGRPQLTRSAPIPGSRSGQLDRAAYATLLRGAPGWGTGRLGWRLGPGHLSRPVGTPGRSFRFRGGLRGPRSRSRGEHARRKRAAGTRIECPSIREQCTGIIEHDDAVTEQAPPLLRTTDHDVCGHAIRRQCVCAPGLMFAHDDLRWFGFT